MDLAAVYDDYLVSKTIEKDRDPLRLFVTDVGKCPRQVALRMLGAKKAETNARQRAMWDVAEYIEKTLADALDVAGRLTGYQFPIPIEDRENWGGRGDISAADDEGKEFGIEVKTVNPMAFKHQDRPKEGHVYQKTIYEHYLDIPFLLWYFDRGSDSNDPEQYDTSAEWEHVSSLMDELERMRAALPELPPILPRVLKKFDKGTVLKQGPAWQCKPTEQHGYCPYSGVSCFPDMSWNKWIDIEPGFTPTKKADMDAVYEWALREADEALLEVLK